MHRSTGRSRGPVPRTTVDEAAALLIRSGSGDPELQSLEHANDRGGQAPALRYPKRLPFTVGRGPVPRHAAIAGNSPRAMEPETIAGDRPPRYGAQHGSFLRRARACPSPCCVNRAIAGDRPPRYGIQNDLSYRAAAIETRRSLLLIGSTPHPPLSATVQADVRARLTVSPPALSADAIPTLRESSQDNPVHRCRLRTAPGLPQWLQSDRGA